MSSLTTAGSMSMEERSVSAVEELELGTHLSLGIAGGGGGSSRPPPPRTVLLFGEVLSLPDDDDGREPTAPPAGRGKTDRGGSGAAAARQNKKARKFQATEDDGDRRNLMTNDDGGGRKKLRLTAAQAAMLEDSFRAHNILAHSEKQELARRVGLSARQVEVWFQNRRARTKLKQTEIDCELLRRWCDRLADENARLRRDLAELRACASASARLAVCVACCGKHKQVAAAAEMA